MQIQRFSSGTLLIATLAVCACATQQDKDWGFNPVEAGPGNGGTTSNGGSVSTGGTSAGGNGTGTGGTAGTTSTGGAGGAATSTGGSNTGGTNTGGTSTGGTSTGGTNTGGTSTGGTSTGGTGTGGAPLTCNTTGFVFCDDFEADTVNSGANGWSVRTGTWSVINDATATAGDQQVYRNSTAGSAASVAGSTQYADATIMARVKINSASTSSANAAGIFIRSNVANDFDLSVGGDGKLYLRRSLTSSTEIGCSSGSTNAASGLTAPITNQWFGLKLVVSGSGSAISVRGYIDTGSGFPSSPNVSCTGPTSSTYQVATGTAGVFSKGTAPAEYDDVFISTP